MKKFFEYQLYDADSKFYRLTTLIEGKFSFSPMGWVVMSCKWALIIYLLYGIFSRI